MIKIYSKDIDIELRDNEAEINNVNNISIGNCINTYKEEKERKLFNLLLKPSYINYILQNRISTLDLNGGHINNA